MAIADLDRENGKGAVAEVVAAGGEALYVETDVSDEDRVRAIGDGLVRFDGTSTHHVLRGHSVSDVHFGPDGYVWAIAARDDGPWRLYVITPEAVAAVG